MDKFPKDFGLMSSSDDFDLLTLGFPLEEESLSPEEEDGEPKINPLHDMDSLEFHLWVEQEAEKEIARRKAAEKAAAAKKDTP